MRKKISFLFWTTNGIIMVMHFINHYFNQWKGNYFDTLTLFLYRSVLLYINILLTIVCIFFLLFRNSGRIRFAFDKEFRYMFLFLLVWGLLRASRIKLEMDFVYYMATVAVFAITLSFLPLENNEAIKEKHD